MSLDRILCLANSYKHENRCVAGVSLITKKWLRLIGRQVPGCLTLNETRYSNGKQAAILDVFQMSLDSIDHIEAARPLLPVDRHIDLSSSVNSNAGRLNGKRVFRMADVA